MTANGDGLNFDPHSSTDPSPRAKPLASSPPPAPSDAQASLNTPDDLIGTADEESAASVFDDGPNVPVGSLDQIPEAIPNISDGGTEILVRGRTERRDFTEEFGAEAPSPDSEDSRDAVAIERHSSVNDGIPQPGSESAPESYSALIDPIHALIDLAPASAIQNPIGGLFFDSFANSDSESGSPSCADTVVGGSPIQELPFASGVDTPTLLPVDLASEFETSHVTSESGEISFGETGDGVLSLSAVTSGGEVTGAISAAKPATPTQPGNQRTILIVLGGYAIVVTALCVLLIGMLAKARSAGQLESLPDLKPLPADKMAIYPTNTELPDGHTLKLGESQRYGNLRVEPLRVSRGPIHFQQVSGVGNTEGFASDPVLKLWVRLTNVSQNQAFVPLDAGLLFRRHQGARDRTRANNFLVEKSRKLQGDPLVFVYKPLSSVLDMVGQQLGKQLQPGESVETYIPSTEEGIDTLKGDLLWRVQLRKGHSPSGAGVTTLVEVAFSQEQIQSEGT